jgi:hypothetical protein
MNSDIYSELAEAAELQGIGSRELKTLIEIGEQYQQETPGYVSDSDVKEIIEEAFTRLDPEYEIMEGTINNRKTTKETFYEAVRALGKPGGRSR